MELDAVNPQRTFVWLIGSITFKLTIMTKKFISFLLLALAVLGSIGGVGYAIYCGAYPIAAGVATLTYLAWPKITECFKNMWEV